MRLPLQELLRHILIPVLYKKLIGHKGLLLGVRLKQLLQHQLRLFVHLLPLHKLIKPANEILLLGMREVVLRSPAIEIWVANSVRGMRHMIPAY